MTGPADRIEVEVSRIVKVLGTDDKPALELEAVGNDVKVTLVPKSGTRRSPINVADLKRAVEALLP